MAGPALHDHRCPLCGEAAPARRFDLAVRDEAGDERTFFGVPAGYCAACGRIVLDTEALGLRRIAATDTVAAIESDSALLQAGERDAA